MQENLSMKNQKGMLCMILNVFIRPKILIDKKK